MGQCAEVQDDPNSPFPVALAVLGVGEIETIRYDATQLFDCDSAGVTITGSTWAEHPDNDAAAVGITPLPEQGNVALCRVEALAAPANARNQRIVMELTASDGRAATRVFEFPIAVREDLSYAA